MPDDNPMIRYRDKLEHYAEIEIANGNTAVAAALFQAAATYQSALMLTEISSTLDAILEHLTRDA